VHEQVRQVTQDDRIVDRQTMLAGERERRR